MTTPAQDDYETNPPFSSPCSMRPLDMNEESAPQTEAETETTPPPEPANENPVHAPQAPPASAQAKSAQAENAQTKSFEQQAEDSFRMALGRNAEGVRDFYSAATEACETAADAMRVSAEQLAAGMTALNMKLFEFGRANAQQHLTYMQHVAGARSVRDLVDVQASYVREQCDALTRQLHELRDLSTEIAGKTAEPFKDQFVRAAQRGRMC